MKRILNLSIYLLLLSTLFISSCSKENLEVDKQSPEDQLQTKINAAAASNTGADFCFTNPDNPYEYVGINHNNALDAVAAHPDFQNLSQEQVYAIIGDYVKANSNTGVDVPYDVAMEAFDMVQGENVVENVVQLGVETGQLSPAGGDRMLQMRDLLFDSADPISYGNSMLQFEEEVMADSDMTDTDKGIILGGAAVARYSACYWSNAAVNLDNPWHYRMKLGNGTGLYWWWPRIHRLILWDWIGFCWGWIWWCWYGWPYCWWWGPWWGVWYGGWWSWYAWYWWWW